MTKEQYQWRKWAFGLATCSVAAVATAQPRQMERLGRGVVAVVESPARTWVSWRLLGTEPMNTPFNVYRATGTGEATKLNPKPLTSGTWFADEKADATADAAYTVRAVIDGREQPADRPFVVPANATAKPYLSVPIQTPQGYAPNDASAADLDGDGQYDLVLHQTGRGKDNSQAGVTDPPILQGYPIGNGAEPGKLLWTINLGPNIREGAHYTQFMVYDLDGDGRAEIVCKTADGTIDGTGQTLGDAKAKHANDGGYILKGPEYLTVFDGLTGKALDTTKYLPGRHPDTENPTGDQLKAVWGDGYGNRGDRFLAAVAYLDGERPSVVMCRGYYTRSVLAAFDFRDGKLTSRWVFDSATPGNEKYAGQGNHALSVNDVDGDGKDEIVYGGMCVDDNGKGLWTTGLGHGDAQHVSDLDPTRPGLESFKIQEPFDDAGQHMVDAKTGRVLWKRASVAKPGAGKKVEGPGRGLAADIDPRHPGAECWSFGAGIDGLSTVRGQLITKTTPKACNFTLLWDGDEGAELLDGTRVMKWDYQAEKLDTLLDAKAFDGRSNNGTKATPTLSADLLGDWREEVIFPTTDGKELRIFTTTIPTDRRLPTLMHDPAYRLAVAWQNVAYNQPPHPSYFIGFGMKDPTPPNIVTVPAERSAAGR